jgi:hypothetical protein
MCEVVRMLQSKSEPPEFFRVGDLVVPHESEDIETAGDGGGPSIVIGVRSDATGPYPLYTVLRPDGTTRVRYGFELRLLQSDEPEHNVTHQS